MPSHHDIVLIDASVAFFPGCVSCAISKTKCRSLGGMKGTTPLEMIPLCIVNASFCRWNPLSASDYCFKLPILFVSLWLGRVCLFQVVFFLGDEISFNEVDVIDCEAHSIFIGFVIIKVHSAQSICVGFLFSWHQLELKVETH